MENLIDFCIGLTLVNALPHYAIGTWRGRMLSIFGLSSRANIAYGYLNVVISLFLYHIRHGLDAVLQDGLYLGALFVIVAYFVVGKACYKYFHARHALAEEKME